MTFPPLPGREIEPANDVYTGPMVQEPEVWSAVCARCGARYSVPTGQSTSSHVCDDLIDDSTLLAQRDYARRLLFTLLDEIGQFELLITTNPASIPFESELKRLRATADAVRTATDHWSSK